MPLFHQISSKIGLQILLSFLAVILLTISGFFIAMHALSQVRSTQQQMTNVTLPLVAEVESFNDELWMYELLIEELQNLPVSERLKQNKNTFFAHEDRIKEVFSQLQQGGLRDSNSLRTIDVHLQAMFKQTRLLEDLLLEDDPALQASFLAHRAEINDALENSFIIIKRFQGTMDDEPEMEKNVLKIHGDLIALQSLIAQADTSFTIDSYRRAQRSYSNLMRSLSQSLSAFVDGPLKMKLAVEFGALFEHLQKTSGFFFDLRGLVELDDAVKGAVSAYKEQQLLVHDGLSVTLMDVRKQSEEAMSALDGNIVRNIVVFYMMGGMYVLCTFLLVFFFVYPRIIMRVELLARNMRVVAGGDYRSKIVVSGHDEISNMEEALETFRHGLLLKDEISRAIELSQKKLSAVLDNTVDGIVTTNSKGEIETFNRGCETIFGYRGNEVIGKNFKILMPDTYHSQYDEYLLAHRQTENSDFIDSGSEVQGERKDGSVFPLELSVSEIEFDGRTLYSGILRDITDRKRAENAIKESHDFQDLIFSHIPDFLFVKDEKYRIVQSNPAFLNVHSQDIPSDIIGTTTFEQFAEDEVEEFLQYDRQAFEEGASEAEETITFPDGRVRTLFTKKVRFEDAEHKRFILGVSRDITDIKNAESELLRSNQELDDFAYIASHDLKEPLRGLHNHARFLMEDYEDELNEDARHRLSRLMVLSQRMEKLINDLLYYSRLGRSELSVQDTDLNAVMLDVADLFVDDGVKIIVEGELPTLHCDCMRIEELFRNLISNAIKYNESDEKRIEVGMRGGDVFYVRDNGIGIDAQFHEDVFKIFKRLHKKESYGGGTGSGLTFVKKIIDRYSGKIWLESELGLGTTFYFTLPDIKRI